MNERLAVNKLGENARGEPAGGAWPAGEKEELNARAAPAGHAPSPAGGAGLVMEHGQLEQRVRALERLVMCAGGAPPLLHPPPGPQAGHQHYSPREC